ncbi:recombinase family protein [Acinetobacter beijerinckii]|uniref:recombinase family protein n=1 Tax=Acinetobacter beijerinckii TaxID=262668 RepID=UPI0036210E8B
MKKEDNEPRGFKVGYARVSSEDQNLDRQLETFKNLGLDKVFLKRYKVIKRIKIDLN